MNYVAIRAENLSKQYQIGVRNRHDTLRDQLMGGLRSLFSRNGAAPERDDTFWALKDVSLEIKKGEVVGIIGRNGAGKARCSRYFRASLNQPLALRKFAAGWVRCWR